MNFRFELALCLLDLGWFHHISENLVARMHHSANLIGDWNGIANDYKKLLAIFFSSSQNAPYKYLESELSSYLFLKISRVGWYFYQDNLFVLKMLIQSTRYSPNYIVQALLRSPSRAADDLWAKLQKVEDGKLLTTQWAVDNSSGYMRGETGNQELWLSPIQNCR